MIMPYPSRTFLAALFLAALPLGAACQVVPPAPTTLPAPLTLAQAVSIALAHQPQQFLARTQVTQAQGQKQQARAQYFPTLTPSYRYQNHSQSFYGISTGSVPTTTGTTIGGTGTGTGTTGTGTTPGTGMGTGTTTTGTGQPITTTTGSTFGSVNEVSVLRGGGLSLSLSQNLFDSGRRETANAQARRALDAAGYGSANTRQTTILSVTQAFYQLLLALDLVKVAQAQVARFGQTVDVTQAQIDAGTVAAKDIFQARADLANAQVTLLQDQNQVRLNSATLKNVLGVAAPGVVQPAPLVPGDALPPLPPDGPGGTLDAAFAQALAGRPDLLGQQAAVGGQEAALAQARREAGFTVSGDYILTYQATSDVGPRGADSQFLVTGSYPLFDAGGKRGAVRIAQAQRDAARDQLEQVRQQVRLDVEQAYDTRATGLEAARLAQAAVTAAQVNYDAVVAARREGIGTVLDITTAQATLTQAQNGYVTAVYNFYIADAQLQRAVGGNDIAVPVR